MWCHTCSCLLHLSTRQQQKGPRPTQTGHTNKHECTLTTTNSDKNEVNLDQADDDTSGLVHVCCHVPTTSSGGPSAPRLGPPLPPRPPRPPLPGDLPPNPLPRPPKLISAVFDGTFCGVWGAVWQAFVPPADAMMCRNLFGI